MVEGDEYDTAYFDKGPKFLHYRARTAMLTSVEFDHADIYRDMAHYESAYEKFAADAARGRLPRRGGAVPERGRASRSARRARTWRPTRRSGDGRLRPRET